MSDREEPLMLKKRPGSSPPPPPPQDPRIVNGIVKLRTLWDIPDLAILNQMLAIVRKDKDVQATEQQWSTDSIENQIFVLRCSLTEYEQPVWTLSTGELGRPPMQKWRYPSGDLDFVLNLITSESTGASLSDLITTTSHKQYSSTPTLTGLAPPDPDLDQDKTVQIKALNIQLAQQSQSSAPSPSPSSPDSTSMLQGDLSLARLPTVLQSIKMSRMTGRLELRDKDGQSDVYFDAGNPVHALHSGSVGDLAITELLSWQSGQFRFHPNERTSERTVKNRLDTLLMEGMTFADQSTFLEQQGLSLSCFPIRKNPNLKQKEFEQIVSNGTPVDMRHALNFYHFIDDTISLLDLLRLVPLHKTEWVPLLFNFINQDLIVLANQPARSKVVAPYDAPIVDMSAAEAAIRGCIRNETGIFTPGAFLYFLNQEFLRFQAGGPPFSIIILTGRLSKKGGFSDYLPEAGVKETLQRIRSLIRPFETLAHFETFDYVLLLPQTEAPTAALVAQRLVLSLKTIPKVDWESDYSFWCGVASVPGDGKDVSTLISAAIKAKTKAVQTKTSVVMFRNLLE